MGERGRTERAGGPGGAGPGVGAHVWREYRYITLPSIYVFPVSLVQGLDVRRRVTTLDGRRVLARREVNLREGERLRRAAFDF